MKFIYWPQCLSSPSSTYLKPFPAYGKKVIKVQYLTLMRNLINICSLNPFLKKLWTSRTTWVGTLYQSPEEKKAGGCLWSPPYTLDYFWACLGCYFRPAASQERLWALAPAEICPGLCPVGQTKWIFSVQGVPRGLQLFTLSLNNPCTSFPSESELT